MTKRYVRGWQRAKCCLGLLLLPVLLPASLLAHLLVGLWQSATYLHGRLSWKWSDELRSTWWILAGALAGRNLNQEREDRWDAEYRASFPPERWKVGCPDRRVEQLDRRLWGRERRKLNEHRLPQEERRGGNDRRTCQQSDRRAEWREMRDAWIEDVHRKARKSDTKHGARRKTDKKRKNK